MSANIKTLYALDFDGVLCDSCGESSVSAWKAAAELWPNVFSGVEEERKTKVLEEMRVVRPVVETGFENILLVRALLEELTAPEEVLEEWGALLPALMDKWGVDRADLVARFGRTRDHWIDTDFPGWLALNSFYPGVAAAVQAALDEPSAEVYIVTTKDARFACALLQEQAGLAIPMERILSTTVSGRPKSEVLAELAAPLGPAAQLHFVEDKLSTLHKVIQAPGFDAWRLHFVDWGFNTAKQREEADKNDRINLIDMAAFTKIMKGDMD